MRENINELQLLRKRALLIIFKVPYLSHTKDMCKQLNTVGAEAMYSCTLSRQYLKEQPGTFWYIPERTAKLEYTAMYPTRNAE